MHAMPGRSKLVEHARNGLDAINLVRGGLILALVTGMMCNVTSRSQQSDNNGIPDQPTPRGSFARPVTTSNSVDEDSNRVMEVRGVQALNTERQKQMVSDVNKLVKLAKELNDEVAKANTGAFTPEQLRKIVEIEKLARIVRERCYR